MTPLEPEGVSMCAAGLTEREDLDSGFTTLVIAACSRIFWESALLMPEPHCVLQAG